MAIDVVANKEGEDNDDDGAGGELNDDEQVDDLTWWWTLLADLNVCLACSGRRRPLSFAFE